MKRTKKCLQMAMFMLTALALLAASVGISHIIQWVLVERIGVSEGQAGIIVSMVQGVVAAIAAGLVLYELKNGEDLSKHQTNVEKAQFILEYNRSFIENENMTEMERYMECMLTGVGYGDISNISNNRQDMINYLVYLEGLASCIQGEVLDLDRIDNLFSYRFFLAMNHPEVQSIDLMPYATYYRGCFWLYNKWLTYRMQSPKYRHEDDWDIPLFASALCYQYGYEKYATPEITTEVSDKTIIVRDSQREIGKLTWTEDGRVTVSISKKYLPKNEVLFTIQRGKLLRAILKELVYNKVLISESKAIYLDNEGRLKCDDDVVRAEFLAIQKAKEIAYREGVHFRQLNRGLKITDKTLERISELIYQTDAYIYPDMFGTEQNAKKILPALLKSGKDKMFNLDNLFVCELNEEVIGILLWQDGALNWSSKELRKVMEQNKVAYPTELSQVEREYVSGYSKLDDNTVSILNVCVAQCARKKHVADRMLAAFLMEHPGKTIELCVLSRNQAAIKLYSSCGFKQYGGEEKAYPNSLKNHTRITMRYCDGM